MGLADFSITILFYTFSLWAVHECIRTLAFKTFQNVLKGFIWKWNLCKCVFMIWHLKGVILSAIFNFITIKLFLKLFQRDCGLMLWTNLKIHMESLLQSTVKSTFKQWKPVKQLLGDQEMFTSVTQCWHLPIFFLHRVILQSKVEQVEIHHKYLNHLVKHNPRSPYFASNYCHMHAVKLKSSQKSSSIWAGTPRWFPLLKKNIIENSILRETFISNNLAVPCKVSMQTAQISGL